MWVAFLKTHTGVHINMEALAIEVISSNEGLIVLILLQMGATKRALDDQFKALRREARALQAPAGASSTQDDSDFVEEEELNVYQRAKRGLPPPGTRQNRGAPTAAKGKGVAEQGMKRFDVSHSVEEDEEEEEEEEEEGEEESGPSRERT